MHQMRRLLPVMALVALWTSGPGLARPNAHTKHRTAAHQEVVPQAEIDEAAASLAPSPAKVPGATVLDFKPISTRALKQLRPWLRNAVTYMTDVPADDSYEGKPAAKRLYVAQLRDDAAGHDVLFVMGNYSAETCRPGHQRTAGESCDVVVYVDEGMFPNWRSGQGEGSDPGVLAFGTDGGPIALVRGSDGTSVVFCDTSSPSHVTMWRFDYSGKLILNAQGKDAREFVPRVRADGVFGAC